MSTFEGHRVAVAGCTSAPCRVVNRVWTVPADRMKTGVIHRVPLSTRAIVILREMKKIKVSEVVFPGSEEGRPLSDMALLSMLRRLGLNVVTHGFRSSFKDWQLSARIS
jgi:integrase